MNILKCGLSYFCFKIIAAKLFNIISVDNYRVLSYINYHIQQSLILPLTSFCKALHPILRIYVLIDIKIIGTGSCLRGYVRVLTWVWWKLVQRNSWLRCDIFGSDWSESTSCRNLVRLLPETNNHVIDAGLFTCIWRIISRGMLFILLLILIICSEGILIKVYQPCLCICFECNGLMAKQRTIRICN